MIRPFLLSSLLFLAMLSSGLAEDERILDIRRQFNQIESANLQPRSIRAGDEASPITLTRYTRGKNQVVAKVVVVSGSDHGATTESFYYDEQGRLFFAFVVSEWGQFTGKQKANGESETIDTRRETRLYFEGTRCLRALRKEVKDPDPKRLRGKIAEEPNVPLEDSEEIELTRESGEAYRLILTRKALDAHLAR